MLRQGWQLGAPDIGSRAAAEELRLVLQLARSGYALVHRWDGVSSDGVSGGESVGSSSGEGGRDGSSSGAAGSGAGSSSSSGGVTADNGTTSSDTSAGSSGKSSSGGSIGNSTSSTSSGSQGNSTSSNSTAGNTTSTGSIAATMLRRGLLEFQWRRGSADNAHPPQDPNLGLPQQLTFMRVSIPHARLRGKAATATPWHAPVSGETAPRMAENGGVVIVPALKLASLQEAAASLREAAAAGAAGSHQDVWREVWRLTKWMGDLTDRGPAGFRCDHVQDPTLPMVSVGGICV